MRGCTKRVLVVLGGTLVGLVVAFDSSADLTPVPTSKPGLAPTPGKGAQPTKILGKMNIIGTASGGNRCTGGVPCPLIGSFGSRDYGKPTERVLRIRGPAPSAAEAAVHVMNWTDKVVTISMPLVPGKYSVRGTSRDAKFGMIISNLVTLDVLAPSNKVGGDNDGDGHKALVAGGDDCDDGDPKRHPGIAEVCDGSYFDEDCNWNTSGKRDTDHDGEFDSRCCNAHLLPGGGFEFVCGADCNDQNPAIKQGVQACGPKGAVFVCQAHPDSLGNAKFTARPDPKSFTKPWSPYTCPSGTSCVQQPNGTGLCH
jgi:hypothetical protein